MSQTIENRIVEMQFENKQFESGVQESLSTLDKLKKSLKFDDAAKNLQDFGKNTRNLDVSGITSSIEKLNDRFSASGIAGMEVIRNLTNFAIEAGKKIASALTAPFEQIKSGGWKRAMNIEDAKFQLKGLDIAWETVADDINYAVADTAFGLDAAAKACAQLSASGIQAGKDMKTALRGISGVAAMGNTEYENITDIFTKAAGNGKVMANELNRISQYGLNARAEVVKFFNDVNSGAEKVKDQEIPEYIQKNVKSLTKGARMAEADLADFVRKGKLDFETFAYAMDYAFGEHAKAANETFMGSLRNIKAALSKIGAEFATPIIHGAIPIFNQVRVFLNDLRKQMGPVFTVFSKFAELISGKIASGLEKFSYAFLKLGAIEHIGNALRNVFTSLVKIIGTIKHAFDTVFPSSNNFYKSVMDISKGIERFSEKLVISDNSLWAFRNVMVVIFSILKNIGSILKNILPIVGRVATVALRIVGVISALVSNLINLVANLDIVKGTMNAIQKAGGLFAYAIERIKDGFNYLKSVLSDTTTVTGRFAMKLRDVALTAAAIVGGTLYLAFMKIKEVISYFDTHDPLGSLINGVKTLINNLKELPFIRTVITGMETGFNAVGIAFTKIVELVKDFINNLKSGMSVIHAIGTSITVVIGGAIELFGRLIDKVRDAFSIFGKDRVIEETIEMPIANAGGALVGMEHTLTKTGETVTKTASKFNKAKGNIVSFGKTVLDAIKSIDTGKLLLFSFSITTIALALNLNKLIKSVTGVTDGIKGLIDTFIEGRKRKSTFLEVMLGISLGLTAIAGALWAISKIPSDQLMNVTLALGSLLTIIGLFSVIGKKGSTAFALSMASFSGSILILVAALAALNQIKTTEVKDLWVRVGILGTIMAAVAGIAFLLSKVGPKMAAGSIALIGFAGSVYVLAKALKIVSEADLKNISDNWQGLTVVVMAFAAFAALVSRVGVAAGLGLLGFVALLKILVDNADNLKKMFGSVQAAFTYIGDTIKSAISYIYNGMKKAAQDMVETQGLAEILAGGTMFVTGILIALITTLGLAGKGLKKAAVGFAILAASIVGLMYAVVKISEFAKAGDETAIKQATSLLKTVFGFLAVLTLFSAKPGEISFSKGKTKFDYKSNEQALKDIRRLLTSMGFLILSIGAFAAMTGTLQADEMERVKGLLTNVIGLLGVISLVITAITAAVSRGGKSEVSFTTFTGIVLLLGSLLGSLVLLMYMFSKVDWESNKQQLVMAGTAFVVISGVLIGILAVVARIEKNKPRKANSFPATVASFVAIIGAIGAFLYFMNREFKDNGGWSEAAKYAGVLGGSLLAITAMVIALEGFSAKFLNTQIRQDAFKKTMSAVRTMILAIIGFGLIFAGLKWVGVDPASMTLEAIVLVSMLATIVYLVTELQKYSKDTKYTFTKKSSENFDKTIKAIGMAFAAIAGLAVMFGLMRNINAKNMAIQALTLVGALTAISLLVLGIEKFMKEADVKNIMKVEGAIGIMIGAFLALALIFRFIISDIPDPVGMIAKSQIIMLALYELAGLVAICGAIAKLGAKIAGGEIALLAMVGIFAILVQIFKVIDNLQTEGIMAKSQTITLVLLELGVLAAAAGLLGGFVELILLGEIGLIAIVGIFAVLVQVFKVIDELKTEGIMAKSQTIILVLFELETVISIFSLLSLASIIGGIGTLAIIGVFAVLVQVFKVIDELHVDGLLAKSQIIVLTMLELETVLSVCSVLSVLAIAGAPGLAAMVGVFESLSEVFLIIDQMHLEGLQEKADIIVSTLLKLEGLSAIGGFIGTVLGPGLMVFAAGITALGAACASVGTNLIVFAAGIDSLAKSINTLTATSERIQTWFKSISVGVVTLSKSIVASVDGLITGIVAAIAKGGSMIFAAAAALGKKLKDGFDSIVSPKDWGKELVQNFASGILSGLPVVAKAALSIGKAVWEYLHFSAGAEKGPLAAGNVKEWGSGLVQNFIGGMGVEIPNVETMVSNIGNIVKSGFENINLQNVLDVSGAVTGKDAFFGDINSMLKAVGVLKQSLAELRGWSSSVEGMASVHDSYRLDMVAKLNKAQQNYNTTLKNTNKTVYEARKAGMDMNDVLKRTNAENDKARKELDAVQKEYDEYMGTAQKAEEATNDFNDALGGIGDAGKGAKESTKEIKDEIADFYDSIQGAISLFDEFNKQTELTSDQLLANMRSQIEGVTEWANQIQQLAFMGIDQGLLQELADMGPQGYEYTNAFVHMTAEQLAEANNLYHQSLMLPSKVTSQVYGSYAVAGRSAASGFLQGMSQEDIKGAAVGFAHDVVDQMNLALDIQSGASQVTYKDGVAVVHGVRTGIQQPAAKQGLETGIKLLSENSIKQKFDDGLFNNNQMYNIGVNITKGIAKGVKDDGAVGDLVGSIVWVANKANNAFTNKEQIKSPSRVFAEFGKFIVLGLAKGLTDNTQTALNAMNQTADSVIDQMRETINKANQALVDDVDKPVITPVLDLSEIQNGSRELDDMLSRNSALNASRSFTSLQNQQWGSQSALLNATMDSSDVVGAISNLQTDIQTLKDAMTNIKVVLDKGTMVGAMVEDIDNALGKRMVYAGRGI